MDYYIFLYESRMFELETLEAISETDVINESSIEKIQDIIKNIFANTLKIFKKFFDDIDDMFTKADLRHYKIRRTPFRYLTQIEKIDPEKTATYKDIIKDYVDEEDSAEALKLINTLVLHPRPKVKDVDTMVKTLEDKKMYNLNDPNYAENTLKRMFPGYNIKLNGSKSVSVHAITYCIFEHTPGWVLSYDDTNTMLKIVDRLEKVKKKLSVEIYDAYREGIFGSKSIKGMPISKIISKLLTLKHELYSNLEFVTLLCKNLKPVIGDLVDYLSYTLRLHELIDKHKSK